MRLKTQDLRLISTAVRHTRLTLVIGTTAFKMWENLQTRVDAELRKKIDADKKRILARRLANIAEGRE